MAKSIKLLCLIALILFFVVPSICKANPGGHWELVDVKSGEAKNHKGECAEERVTMAEGTFSLHRRYFKGVCNTRKEEIFSATSTWTRPPKRLNPGEIQDIRLNAKRGSNIPGLHLSHGVSISTDGPDCGCGLDCGGKDLGRAVVYSQEENPNPVTETAKFKVPSGSKGESFALRFCYSGTTHHGQPGFRYIYQWVQAEEKTQGSTDHEKTNVDAKKPSVAGKPSVSRTPPGAINPSCWNKYSPDRRSFATQPGGVFPVMGSFRPGLYEVHVGAAGKNAQKTPTTWKTYGPFQLKGGCKYRALINDDGNIPGSPLNQKRIPYLKWEENHRTLSMYSKPGPSEAIVYARNEVFGDVWYAICLQFIGPSPPPITQNPPPSSQRPHSDDGWAPIGGSSSSTTRNKNGNSDERQNIPKGHTTKYGF
jgi:hypothetical protein